MIASKRLLLTSIYVVPMAALIALASGGGFNLPGSQPNPDDGYQFQSAELCSYCHGNSQYVFDPDTGGIDTNFTSQNEPHFLWSGSMMAQAARDPIFRAALTIAEQDAPGVGEFCWRCHSPTAWLEGRSQPYDGSNFHSIDLQGVTCDNCHRMVDPLSEEGRSLVDRPVPGTGNGMYVISPDTAKRGPLHDAVANHEWLFSDYHNQSQLCGSCHEVSNPLHASNKDTQKPFQYTQIARTFSEWELSYYSKQGKGGSCQSCHMPPREGRTCGYDFAPVRNLHTHGFAGSNYWALEILPMFWNYDEREWDALQAGKYRALQTLRRAAKLTIVQYPKAGQPLVVRVTNLTGHKLPTGDPEARRMWLHVQFFNTQGQLIGESGAYDFQSGILNYDENAKVYESKPGILGEGPTYHLVLNNTFFKDNRIPPRGFRNAAFARRKMAPVGATYADGQYWDDTAYQVPAGTARIEVKLYYQVITKEYIEFLRSANTTDDWGERLYQAWLTAGKAPPVVIASVSYPEQQALPETPSNVQAQALSYSRIRLTWSPPQNDNRLAYYEIWRKSPGSTRFELHATTARTETEFLDTGLHPETTYQYYVKAVKVGNLTSQASSQASETTHGL